MASAFWRIASASAEPLARSTSASPMPMAADSLVTASAIIFLPADSFSDAACIASARMSLCFGREFGGLARGLGRGGHGIGILVGLELGGLLVRFRLLDLLDQVLLGRGLGIGDGDLLLALGGGEGLGVLHLLLLLDHGFFHDHPLADDFLDFLALLLDGLLRLDLFELGDAFAFDLLDHALAFDAFEFHAVGALLVALGDQHLALLVLIGDGDLLVRGDAGDFRLAALLFARPWRSPPLRATGRSRPRAAGGPRFP